MSDTIMNSASAAASDEGDRNAVPDDGATDAAAPTLPLITTLPNIRLMSDAFIRAVDARKAVPVIGPQGVGKSVAKENAVRELKAQLEHRAQNGGARPQILSLGTLRHDHYDDILTHVLKKLDRRVATERRGRKLKPNELRDRICELIEKKRVVLIVVDECEVITRTALAAFRDIMAETSERARRRAPDAAIADDKGVGLVLVGTGEAEEALQSMSEFGERILPVVRAEPIRPVEASRILLAWLPKMGELVSASLADWQRFVSNDVCQSGDTTLRRCEAIVREYRHRLIQQGVVSVATPWEELPAQMGMLRDVVPSVALPQFRREPVGGRRVRR